MQRTACGLVIAILAGAVAGAAELRTSAHQDTSPKFVASPARTIDGFCIDLLRAMTQADPGLQFLGEQQWQPLARVLSELRAAQQDAACGLARTPERADYLLFVDPPLLMNDYVLIARAEDDIVINNWDDVRKLGAQGVVLSNRGLFASHVLETTTGVIYDTGSVTLQQCVQKLLAGRGRLVLYRTQGLEALLAQSGLADKVRVLPVVMSSAPLYFALGKHVPSAAVDQVRRALQRLQKDGMIDRLYQHWYGKARRVPDQGR